MEIMKPSEVAALFHVTVRTIQNWDKAGILPSIRTITGRRHYDRAVVMELLQKVGDLQNVNLEKGVNNG
jgi:DNA-binding transcriptional MerR regulator